MIDYIEAREKMVDCQIRTVDVTDHAVLSAFLDISREDFVPEKFQALAYIDQEVSLSAIGAPDRHLMTPAQIGKILQAADIDSNDVVLVIGAGSGYTSAVLSKLASSIVAIEDNPRLIEFARQALSANGCDTVAVLEGQLRNGLPKEAPYDVIFIEGAVDEVPQDLFEQLAEGGRLVAVVGHGNSGKATMYEKFGGIVSSRMIMNCAAKPLPGFAKQSEFAL